MNKITLFLLTAVLTLTFSCKKEVEKQQHKEEITKYLKQQITMQEIPGLALAVVKNGTLIYEGYFGESDREKHTKVSEKTIFPLYSVTKLMVSTAVMQLVQQHKISLDDSLSIYFKDLPKSWNDVQIKHILTHSSGLPDFQIMEWHLSDEEAWNKIIKEEKHFSAGHKFEYNQTNYWLLAQIIEKVSGKSFEDFIFEKQFPNAGASVVMNSDFTDKFLNRAVRYDFSPEKKVYENMPVKGTSRFYAANGINANLKSLIKWNALFDGDMLLKPAQKNQLWKPFEFENGKDSFLHGWHVYTSPNDSSYGFTGGAHTGIRKFVDKDLTVILLTNGYKYFHIHNDIINKVAGIIDASLINEKADTQHKLLASFLQDDIQTAIATYHRVKKKNPEKEIDKNTPHSYENTLNNMGYLFIKHSNVADAIQLFELNTLENPTSSNCFDSLGEGYFINNQLALAKENYEKALVLNPGSDSAIDMLKKIEAQSKTQQDD